VHIPILNRGSVILMMAGAAVTPLFVAGAHTSSASETVRVQGPSARAPSTSLGESPEYASAASPGDRLNAYLETANELWSRTHDARAVRELLRVAQEDLAAAAQPTARSRTPNAANAPVAIASVGAQAATAQTSPAAIARTAPAATVALPSATLAAAAAASPLFVPAPSFTIRASVHDHEGERLQRQLAAWRAGFEILSAAGPNLAAAAIPEGGDETRGTK
jgi:hypothetical protein